MDDTTSLGRFIRESRLHKGMSLGQLAANIGRSPSSVRRWERDEVAPAIAVMPQLAEVLDVDVTELETRRPSVDEPEWPTDAELGEQKHTTVEQPVSVSQEALYQEPLPPPESRRVGFVGDMWNSIFAEKESWIGWVRGIATALVLLLFLFVLIWAGGEFIDALSDVWQSFDTDGSSTS
jgi:transcriptional regulator with XRE-family HTH domain